MKKLKLTDQFQIQKFVTVKTIVDSIYSSLETQLNSFPTKKQILEALTPEVCQEYATKNYSNLEEYADDHDGLINADFRLDFETANKIGLITKEQLDELMAEYI